MRFKSTSSATSTSFRLIFRSSTLPEANTHTHAHSNLDWECWLATLFTPRWRPWLTRGKGYVDPFLQPTSQRLVNVPGKVGGSEDHDHLRGVLLLSVAHTWFGNRKRNIQIWLRGTTTVSGEFNLRMFVGEKKQTTNTCSVALTIHLNQKLGLDPAAGLVLVWGPSPATDGVDLIYEDGCWCVKPSLGHTSFARRCRMLTYSHCCSMCAATNHFKKHTDELLWLAPVFGGERGGRHVKKSSPTFCGHGFG